MTGPDALPAGRALSTRALPLDHEPLDLAQVRSGSPSTGVHELGTVGGASIGVWEITPGVSTDVETDEVFVVVAGRAELEIEPEDDAGERIRLHLEPGSVCRLRAGMRTVWSVSETLRKVYILGPE